MFLHALVPVAMTFAFLGLLAIGAYAWLAWPRAITFNACVIGEAEVMGAVRSWPLGLPSARMRKGQSKTIEKVSDVSLEARRFVIPSDVALAFRVDSLRLGETEMFHTSQSIPASVFTEIGPGVNLKGRLAAGDKITVSVTCIGETAGTRLGRFVRQLLRVDLAH